MHRVTLVPGAGIGPEIVSVTRDLVDALGVPIDWEERTAGEGALAEHGTPMPGELLESVARTRVCLKGPLTTPVGSGFRSINVSLDDDKIRSKTQTGDNLLSATVTSVQAGGDEASWRDRSSRLGQPIGAVTTGGRDIVVHRPGGTRDQKE